jgi:hypothetical protein
MVTLYDNIMSNFLFHHKFQQKQVSKMSVKQRLSEYMFSVLLLNRAVKSNDSQYFCVMNNLTNKAD